MKLLSPQPTRRPRAAILGLFLLSTAMVFGVVGAGTNAVSSQAQAAAAAVSVGSVMPTLAQQAVDPTQDRIQPRTTPAESPAASVKAETDRTQIDSKTGALPDFRMLYNTSPLINSTIILLSAFSLVLFVYYLFTMNTRVLMPTDFINTVTRLAVDGKFDEAAHICRNNRSIFAAPILQRCLEHAGHDHSIQLSMVEAEGKRQAEILWNRLSYLADIINVAPMLGLLGTVVGMLQAFFVLPSQSASINSRLLSEAIGGAMSTTMFGLIVAIVTMVFYSVIKARLTATLMEVEQAVHQVADHISRVSDRAEQQDQLQAEKTGGR